MVVLIPHNIASKNKEERDKVIVDLAASGVICKEHMNMPVFPMEVEMQQAEEYREYFRERLQLYRNAALQFPCGTDPVYQKEGK